MTTDEVSENTDWLEDPSADDEAEESQIDEYDLASSPNDFNVMTIASFIDSGAVKIPGFQRHYVWDIKRASKLIESIIIGLPVPQIFLYEESRNNFLVIDGQQRLMTIYYFFQQRFPRRDKRVELRRLLDSQGNVPSNLLQNDEFFEDFRLRLPDLPGGRKNRFTGLKYATLDDYASQFQLRTIRNVIVKQVRPADDDSSIYEMFNRLNTGGVNLTPQEIRSSLYHSAFMDSLARMNLDPRWRRLVGSDTPELHMRDVEVLLRAHAMWYDGASYKASMVKFLNNFAKRAKRLDDSAVRRVEADFDWFLNALESVPRTAFLSRQQKLMLPLFEAVYAGSRKLRERGAAVVPAKAVQAIREDAEFAGLSQAKTADTNNVRRRIAIAAERLTKAAEV
jgi:uncharacterized protein DUF262